MAVAEQTGTFKRLTPEQRERWERDGYVIVKNAISRAEIEELTAAVDRIDLESQREGRDPNSYYSPRNVPEEDDAFLRMVDHPNTLGIIMDLIGPNIHLIASRFMVRPPTPEPGLRWHEDGPAPYPFPAAGGRTPLLNLKIGWFLTDVDRPNMGNFVCVPGSHVTGFPADAKDVLGLTSSAKYKDMGDIIAAVPGAVQLTFGAGDAFLFHNGLWHAVAPNLSNVRRKNLYYVYAPLWHRLADRVASSPELIARANPIQKQLLGALPEKAPTGGMFPSDESAPLISLFEGKSIEDVRNEQIANRVHTMWH